MNASPAVTQELLVQLEQSEAFKQLIVLPYQQYAAGALHRAIAEVKKPAGPIPGEMKEGEPYNPTKIRNLQLISDHLRDYVLYNEVATLVSGRLADLRTAQARREKAAAAQDGQKDLPENPEQA